MSNNRKNLPLIGAKTSQRGSVLIEMMVSAIVFAIVVASIAFYFVYHVGTINNGRAQLKLQRVGSLLMEQVAKAVREGRATDLAEENPPSPKLTITYPDATTKCFSFDGTNTDILEGPDEDNLSPLEVLDDSQITGSVTRIHRIACDALEFEREGNCVIIRFTLRHDLDNGDGDDDLEISFGSTVKLRG